MAIVLASASRVRARLLADAGVDFRVHTADLDERAAEAPLVAAGAPPEDRAALLAAAKAQAVSAVCGADLVVGADQTLDFEGDCLHKPADMAAARRQLLHLSGRSHRLHSAVACARGGAVVWQHLATATLVMRPFTPAFVDRYLAAVGEAALSGVGAYQVEGRGIQLFSRIDGDFFAVLGLPLLPLLDFLRTEGLLDT